MDTSIQDLLAVPLSELGISSPTNVIQAMLMNEN